ncbi:primosome assembly protein PriA [Nocardioides sp. B-3]|uniref:primosomal protein N' family DNA-binding protein n=1 Tax=Nocardioides sp. B-3 TaxID=2895565 RepID=UPI002152E5E5|nr:primosome assembly protein PriA [Nocardioides sp. B-3]UUZ58963.1 primosome assembly protein PriA [Nocardioides sp. B-3]
MTNHEAGPAEMLPGLRASVADAKAKAAATRARKAAEFEPAEVDPVARVLVDVPLAHLDRPFDYAVAVKDAATAVPGARVKVRFAGRDVDGFVLERAATSDHPGRLQPLRRVVSPEPVLHLEIAVLTASIAERYAGARADVLRLAVPPRHAAGEKEPSPPAPGGTPTADPTTREHVVHGPAFLSHLGDGASPRAVWNAAPGDDWPVMLAHAAAATLASGRGSLICVPDQRDAQRVSSAPRPVLGVDQHVVLSAEAGPAKRYREFLAVSRGARKVVVGTRSAALAPVHDLGLVVIWDDGDDLHAEPRAPYPHVREVLALRAAQQDTAMLVGGFARTCEGLLLLRSGWAHELTSDRAIVRARARVDVVPAEDRAVGSRIPRAAYDVIREGLTSGPGARPDAARRLCPLARLRALPDTCAVCHVCRAARARRPHDTPDLPLVRYGRPGVGLPRVRPPRAASAGARGRAHRRGAGPVLRGHDHPQLQQRPRSHTGLRQARPRGRHRRCGAAGGRGLCRGRHPRHWLTLAREDLRANEEALRRWLGAAGLVRPGGRVVVVGDPAVPALQALVRWDPAGFAERELAERTQTRLPPAARLATITGEPGALDDALTLLALPEVADLPGARPGRPRRATRGDPGAPRLRTCPLRCARRAPTDPQRTQARRRTHPGRSAHDLALLGGTR